MGENPEKASLIFAVKYRFGNIPSQLLSHKCSLTNRKFRYSSSHFKIMQIEIIFKYFLMVNVIYT